MRDKNRPSNSLLFNKVQLRECVLHSEEIEFSLGSSTHKPIFYRRLKMNRYVYALLVASVIVTACAASTPSAYQPGTVIATTAIYVPTATPNPQDTLDETIEAAWPAWLKSFKEATPHVFNWENGDPFGFSWDPPTTQRKCDFYSTWDYLVPSPVKECTGWSLPNFGDMLTYGITVRVGPLKDWYAVPVIPTEGGELVGTNCWPIHEDNSTYLYQSRVEVTVNVTSITFDMPSFGVIQYNGQEYRLPEDYCLTWEASNLALPKAEWTVGNVPTVTIETLLDTYGQSFDVEIIRHFRGDPSILVDIDGTQYLLRQDLLVQSQEALDWMGEYVPIMPGWGRVTVSKDLDTLYGCFQYNVEAISGNISTDLRHLEGQYIHGQAEDVCFDTLVAVDGKNYMLPGYVFDEKNYVYGAFEGYAHLEYNLYVTSTPRDPQRDQYAITLAEQIRQMPGDWPGKPEADDVTEGPHEACWVLQHNWSYVSGLSPAIVEWTCGEPLFFTDRYVVSEMNSDPDVNWPWYVGISRVPMTTPIVLTAGSAYRIDFRSFVEFNDVCGEGGGAEIWINRVSRGEITSQTHCVKADEYLFVLPRSAYNENTGEYQIENSLVFQIK